MANVLSRYGIKEVADVTFYTINETTGEPNEPVLYLDTLKVSTIEQTSENSEARGGKGNAALIAWDYGKEITVTLEDALYSPKSLALIFGKTDTQGLPVFETATSGFKIFKTFLPSQVSYTDSKYYAMYGGAKVELSEVKGWKISANNQGDMEQVTATGGGSILDVADVQYITGKIAPGTPMVIDVSADGFPGTYYVTGDTYARRETDGVDEYFQFIIPKAKVLAESNTITLEAEGDPTVFNMSLKVLRPKDGVMMKLVQYGVTVAS